MEKLPPVAVGRTESCLFCPLVLTQPWLAVLSTSHFSPQEFGEFRATVANASLVISKIVPIHSLAESCQAGAALGEGIMSVVTPCAADMHKCLYAVLWVTVTSGRVSQDWALGALCHVSLLIINSMFQPAANLQCACCDLSQMFQRKGWNHRFFFFSFLIKAVVISTSQIAGTPEVFTSVLHPTGKGFTEPPLQSWSSPAVRGRSEMLLCSRALWQLGLTVLRQAEEMQETLAVSVVCQAVWEIPGEHPELGTAE